MLRMITEDLRSHTPKFDDCLPVTEAVLQFAVCTLCRCEHGAAEPCSRCWDGRQQIGRTEREFIFDLAKKLGVSSLRIFSGNWQSFLSCHELQQLIVSVAAPPEANILAPELIRIIDEFYESRFDHDEDSCLLLTKYFQPGDAQYANIVSMIVKNADHYEAEALFQLAQLQASNRLTADVMNDQVFAIVSTAVGKLGHEPPSQKILDYVDCAFLMCTSGHEVNVTKFVSLLCKQAPERAHLSGVILRVLQRVGASHASLMQSSASELGKALIASYRRHFEAHLSECGGRASYAATTALVAHMRHAQSECAENVKDGQALFQSEIVDYVRLRYHSRKKLMELLAVSFPPPAAKKFGSD